MNISIETISKIPIYFSYIIGFSLLIYFVIKQGIPKIKWLKKIILVQIIALFAPSIYTSIIQYITWAKDPIMQYSLPPHTSITYFLRYTFLHHFDFAVFTTIFALLIFFTIKLLNKKFNKRFFYEEEKYLCTIGILANPYPVLFIFLTYVILGNLITQVISNIKSKNRIAFLNYWIPCIILSIFSSSLILNQIPALKDLIL